MSQGPVFFFCTVTFTSELIAKRHNPSWHYKGDYSTNALYIMSSNCMELMW